jgi:xylulose-5-phosphate/fructose-6-phosphate phosphoketolase
VPELSRVGAYVKKFVSDKLTEHREYITTYGKDMPEISDWKWPHA